MKKILLTTILTLALVLSACNKNKKEEITVIATSIPHAEILEITEPILKEKGYSLKIIVTSDYYFPNPAVANNEADANFFQHIPFLNTYNNDNPTKQLVIAHNVHIEPIGLYSKKYSKLEDIENNASVLISNSTSDHGRILKLFSDAGLITLSESFDIFSNEINFSEVITSNPKNINFSKRSAPDLLIAAYNSNEADLYVINSNYALEGNLNPLNDSIFIESTENNPYVNVLVTKESLLTSEKIIALVDALKSDAVKDFITEKYSGSVINA